MAGNNFKAHVKGFGEKYLLPRKFAPATPWAFEKTLEGLCQGIGFVKGTRGREGMFTLDVYLRYMTSPRNAPWAMDCHRTIGEFSSGSDEWYPIDDEQSYEVVAGIFLQNVEPFLKAHESIEAIVHDFEEGRYSPKMLFGPDDGWMHFNIGFAYLWIGNKDKAAEHLKLVVEKYSNEDYDWVQERKKLAIEGLERIASPV